MRHKQFDSILGIDIGGSGLKGAVVNMSTGKFVTEKFRIPTPSPATTTAVAEVFRQIVEHFNWTGPIGCGVPAIVRKGVTLSAANIDESFINADVQSLFSDVCGLPVEVLNDADAAGIAELHFGEAHNTKDMMVMLTLGTGIGSAIFSEGILIHNTELGHLKFKDSIAEKFCSDGARKKLGLDWAEYGKRLNEYLRHIELLFSPDLIILGGGGSKHFDKFSDQIKLDFALVKPAKLLNDAGIIGAAYFAYEKHKPV
ncbi:MAG: polyphosphate--glucose phosphotransferase [Saprospiraceae bacterium]